MKRKAISTVLVLCLLLGCVGCGAKELEETPEATNDDTTSLSASVALTVNSHSISPVELNYFYVDAINEFVNMYSNWISYILDTSTPLNEQFYEQTTGTTWAD